MPGNLKKVPKELSDEWSIRSKVQFLQLPLFCFSGLQLHPTTESIYAKTEGEDIKQLNNNRFFSSIHGIYDGIISQRCTYKCNEISEGN